MSKTAVLHISNTIPGTIMEENILTMPHKTLFPEIVASIKLLALPHYSWGIISLLENNTLILRKHCKINDQLQINFYYNAQKIIARRGKFQNVYE